MPSSPTTRNRIEKQATGENLNVWGDRLNQYGLDLIDEALDGVEPVTITGAGIVLTSSNYASDQARNRCLVLSGTLTGNATITIPSVEKVYLVVNNTTASGFTLTMKTSGGTGYALRPGPQWVYCDAGDVRRGSPRLNEAPLPDGAVDLNGQSLTNGAAASFSQPVTVGAPTANLHAATKKYVDDTAFAMIGGSFPGQSGNAGLSLVTNGSVASWAGGAPIFCGDAGGTINALAVTTGLSLAAYRTGLAVQFRVLASNGDTATLNVDGLGAKPILLPDGSASSSGDLAEGTVYQAAYDGTGFRLIGGSGGKVDLAKLMALGSIQIPFLGK